MGDSFDDLSEDGDPSADPKALPSPGFEPGESIVWTGRPDPAAVARQAMPRSLFGLIFSSFVLFWMSMVVQGGNNNWDRERVVGPFATHNVITAACAGLWLLPAGIFMLTSPLRARWSARRTRYLITDRRAVIIEPNVFRGWTTRNYASESLALTRCDERPDGSGDLVFNNHKTWIGMSQPVGFLGVECVRDVETLMQRVLLPARQPKPEPGHRIQSEKDSISEPASGQRQTPRSYKLPGLYRAGLAFFVVVFSIAILLLVVDVIFFPLVFLMGTLPGGIGPKGFWRQFLGLLVFRAGFILMTGRLLTIPVEITIDDRPSVTLRGWFRTRTVPVGEIVSISTGGWRDPNCFLAEIRHKGGKLLLVNHFSDFRDFLVRVKELNPGVDVKRF